MQNPHKDLIIFLLVTATPNNCRTNSTKMCKNVILLYNRYVVLYILKKINNLYLEKDK